MSMTKALLKAQKARKTPHLTRAEYFDLISYMRLCMTNEAWHRSKEGTKIMGEEPLPWYIATTHISRYILDKHHNPVPCKNLLTWGQWMENADRIVDQTRFVMHRKTIRVSTIFLGLDHNYWGDGPPILFETMIFGGKHDQYRERCSTWEEANRRHTAAVVMAMQQDGGTFFEVCLAHFMIRLNRMMKG